MTQVIICDLDGTLCNDRHRLHLASAGDWDGYHQLIPNDTPVAPVQEFLKSSLIHGVDVIFMTGRPNKFRQATVDTLSKTFDMHLHDDYKALIMRQDEDWGKSAAVKKTMLSLALHGGIIGELLHKHNSCKAQGADLEALAKQHLLFLEDRDDIVAQWRDLGYHCWQVSVPV